MQDICIRWCCYVCPQWFNAVCLFYWKGDNNCCASDSSSKEHRSTKDSKYMPVLTLCFRKHFIKKRYRVVNWYTMGTKNRIILVSLFGLTSTNCRIAIPSFSSCGLLFCSLTFLSTCFYEQFPRCGSLIVILRSCFHFYLNYCYKLCSTITIPSYKRVLSPS